MEIETFVLGEFQTNCYVVREDETTLDCVIIDPGYDIEQVIEHLDRRQWTPREIWLTHGHCDHIAGIPALKASYPGLPVWAPRTDAGMLQDNIMNLSGLMGLPLRIDPADHVFDVGDKLVLGAYRFEALSTPGHTPGGVSLYCAEAKVVFSGDALFADSVGRTDFPGGDRELLIRKIREELFALDDQIAVYSGHGPATTIGREKRGNPFCRLTA